MKFRYIILSLIVFVSVTACKDKMVCAAYQSTYLLDDERQVSKFSFFDGDSLILEASNAGLKKNIYGIKERDYGYWRQERLLVIDQKDVYSKEVDSLLNKRDSVPVEQAEYDPNEVSLSADSVSGNEVEDPWANTKRFKYNVDFVNYMLLVGNDVLIGQSAARDSAAAKEKANPTQVNDSSANKSGGFFKKLFSGKKKEKKPKKEKPTKENDAPVTTPIIEQSIEEEDN